MTEAKEFAVTGVANLQSPTRQYQLPRDVQKYLDLKIAELKRDIAANLTADTTLAGRVSAVETLTGDHTTTIAKLALGVELAEPVVVEGAIDFNTYFGAEKIGDWLITHAVAHGEEGASTNIPLLTFYDASFAAVTSRISVGRLVVAMVNRPKVVVDGETTTVETETIFVQIWMPFDTNTSIWVREGVYTYTVIEGGVEITPESIDWGTTWRKFGFLDIDLAAIYAKLATIV